MIDIDVWMAPFLRAVEELFGDRLWFVGLQGSYARGEAIEESDIDPVVILDELTADDIQAYGAMLDTLPHRERICGFLGGKAVLLSWEPSDLFQFYHDTTPMRGSLDALLPLLNAEAVDRAIKIGACTVYHGCVHNMLHERSDDVLKGLYKSATFVVQAIVFRQTGRYVSRHAALLKAVSPAERGIVETYMAIKERGVSDLHGTSVPLLVWAKGWIELTP
jgi:hypothetical protein